MSDTNGNQYNSLNEKDELLTSSEAAAFLRISRPTLSRLIRATADKPPRLKCFRVASKPIFSMQKHLRPFLEASENCAVSLPVEVETPRSKKRRMKAA
jgi:hypothetical protein